MAGWAAGWAAGHRVAVAPYWPGVASALAVDRAHRTRQLRDGGMVGVLDTLHPRLHWRPPFLEMESAEDVDYHLGGRGLLLVPAVFFSYPPCDPGEEQPTLYYDIAGGGPPHPLTTRLGGPHGGLAALLGHSRAAALEAIAEGVSTSQLARRAGLVTARRTGRTSHHSLTPLGAELLFHAATSPPRSDLPH